MTKPAGRNDPQEWTDVAAGYAEVNDPPMALWADEALRLSGLAAGERVLDVAAGTGALAVRAAKLASHVVATDFSDGMVAHLAARIADEGLANVEVRKMDGQALTLPDASFDVAFSLFGLIFFPDRGRGFSELLRVLVPGGRAVVAGWAPLDTMPVLSTLLGAVREALPELPPPPRPVPAESLSDPVQLATEMIEAGFDDVSVLTRRVSFPLPGSAGDLVAAQARGNLFLAGLSRRLPPPEWARVAAHAAKRIEEAFGPGPYELVGVANLGLGFRAEEDEDDGDEDDEVGDEDGDEDEDEDGDEDDGDEDGEGERDDVDAEARP